MKEESSLLYGQSTQSNGPDEISGHMLLLCDESFVLPLKLSLQNILFTGRYPNGK